MILNLLSLLIAGFATISNAQQVLTDPTPIPPIIIVITSYDVRLNLDTGLAGTFIIGGANNTLNLHPRLDMDVTMIAAPNCTECPSRKYEAPKSEEAGMLKPLGETRSISLATFEFEDRFLANGSYVSDIMSTRSEDVRQVINNFSKPFEFFLIHNITGDRGQIDMVKNSMGDGYLGLTTDLGSQKDTYGMYLKKLGVIDSNSFSVDFDY